MIDATPYLSILQNFGISVSASAFVEFLKAYFQTRRTENANEFETQLNSFLQLHGANVRASTLINAFAERGLLSIQNSSLYAPNQVTIGAGLGAQFRFGNNSVSQTKNTGIVAGAGAQITGSNAAISQNPNGSISFHVGGGGEKK